MSGDFKSAVQKKLTRLQGRSDRQSERVRPVFDGIFAEIMRNYLNGKLLHEIWPSHATPNRHSASKWVTPFWQTHRFDGLT